MDTTAHVAGLHCRDCGATAPVEAATRRCPDCQGQLDVAYDLAEGELTPADFEGRGTGLARFEPLLPLKPESIPSIGAGGTPLVEAPELAADIGVAGVQVKDEGCNPTGALADREMALAVGAAAAAGADAVALPSMGNDAQAAAAAASRAGLASESFVPTRTPFVNKALINVHGGDMSVVEGRFADAAGVFAEASAEAAWESLAPFDTPYRQEGARTVALEILWQRDWEAPGAIVVPTGHGIACSGIYGALQDCKQLGLIDSLPRLFAAQAGGCAPLATAWKAAEAVHEPVEHPDTVVGPLEIPDPSGGERVLAALEETGGAAIATGDQAIMAGAVEQAEAGLPVSVTGGAAVSGVTALAEQGAFDADEEIVLVDPLAASKEADLLRSHLMGKGK